MVTSDGRQTISRVIFNPPHSAVTRFHNVGQRSRGFDDSSHRPRDRARFPSWAIQPIVRFLVLFGAAAVASAESPRVLLLDAALAGSEIVAVGEGGTIVRSADSGGSWTPASSFTTATLTGIAFAPDSLHGWAVGHDALILATSDGGRTWQKQWQAKNLELSFLDVCALDAQRVFAVGAFGLFLATTDGGKNWTTRRVLDDDMHLNRITRGPTGTLYLAGEHGTLRRSTDAGATWTRLDSPYDGSFYGILPLGPRTLLAYGLRGRVFRSTDDGDGWEPIKIDRPMLIVAALKIKSGALMLAGQSRALFISADDGATFSPSPINFSSAIAELVEAPDGTVLAFGEAGATRLGVRSDVASPMSARSAP